MWILQTRHGCGSRALVRKKSCLFYRVSSKIINEDTKYVVVAWVYRPAFSKNMSENNFSIFYLGPERRSANAFVLAIHTTDATVGSY